MVRKVLLALERALLALFGAVDWVIDWLAAPAAASRPAQSGVVDAEVARFRGCCSLWISVSHGLLQKPGSYAESDTCGQL
jgi:hypothetical protein